MRSVLFCLMLVAAASAYLEVPKNYHLEVGIPAATRIKETEDKILSEQNNVQSKIIGGVIAPVNEHPYLGGLVITFWNHAGSSACGSSLISPNRLVTAAHCWHVGSLLVRQFVVVLGSQFLFSGGTRIPTNNVVAHPQWNRNFLQNDIAIIYLPTEVTYTPSIWPITLPHDTNNTFVGQRVIAAGYGKSSDAQTGVSINTMVRNVNLFVMDNAMCQRSYGSNYIRDNVLCTYGTGGVGICGGDSGGPLVLRSRFGQVTLVGVSSFAADKACERGHPSGFVRVTSHYNWILRHL